MIAQNKKHLKELEDSKISINENIIRLESKNEELTKRKEDINFKDQEIQDLDELKSKLEEIENAKRLQQKKINFRVN